MRKGFSLIEVLFAVMIFAAVVGMAMGGWIQFLQRANYTRTQAELDADVRRVIERFRFEMRNTARETIIFYPSGAEPYEAVGFALPADQDDDGLMDMAGSNLLWRQTVVYHVWNHSPHQMRRTQFTNRDPDASHADRYQQIADVVTDGHGANACLSGEQTATMVLFENLFTGRLWHASSSYDGYAPQANTRERTSFGSLPLGPGAHTVNFTVTGMNSDSSGRKLRLDRISASVSGWPVEAEHHLASGVGGTIPYLVGQNLASAAYGLVTPTTSDGQSLSLAIHNDAIEECLFIGEGRNVAFSNTVVRFDAVAAPAAFSPGLQVAKLDGQFGADKNWSCADQTAHYRNTYFYATNGVVRIPVMADLQRNASGEPSRYGLRKDGFGPVFRLYKSLYNGGLKILNPSYAVLTPTNTPADFNSNLLPKLDPDDLVPLEFWYNGDRLDQWISCANQQYVELRPAHLRPIPMGATLMLQFEVTVETVGSDRFTVFDMRRTEPSGVPLPGCWVIPGGSASLLQEADWSSQAGLDCMAFVPTLEFATVNYAEQGDYISPVYDTKSEAPKTFDWLAHVPSGASLTMYARSGHSLTTDGFGIAGAMTWDQVAAVSSGSTFVENEGRYVQFRAVFTAQPSRYYPGAGVVGTAGPYRSDTPRLRLARFTWDGAEQYVDVAAELLKAPDGGMFSVDVDGRDLVQGVTMEIAIFKDVRTFGGKSMRLTSAMLAEVDPRNSMK